MNLIGKGVNPEGKANGRGRELHAVREGDEMEPKRKTKGGRKRWRVGI